MNTSEHGRASNTGSLIPLSSEGSRVFLQGVRADHDALAALIADPRRRAVLLYPSEDALTTDKLLEREKRAAEAAAVPPERGRRLVIVIDGTWNSARKLLKGLPGPDVLPRIRLLPHQCTPGGESAAAHLGGGGGGGSDSDSDGDGEAGEEEGGGGGRSGSGRSASASPAGGAAAAAAPARIARSLLYPVRKYGGAAEVGRVCTLEAVVGLLRALGEAEESSCEALLNNLKARCFAAVCLVAGRFVASGAGGEFGAADRHVMRSHSPTVSIVR